MLDILVWVEYTANRSLRLHPDKRTMGEYSNPVWESSSEVRDKLDTLTP